MGVAGVLTANIISFTLARRAPTPDPTCGRDAPGLAASRTAATPKPPDDSYFFNFFLKIRHLLFRGCFLFPGEADNGDHSMGWVFTGAESNPPHGEWRSSGEGKAFGPFNNGNRIGLAKVFG